MDGDLRSLLITLGLDTVIFSACIFVFLQLREDRGDNERVIRLSGLDSRASRGLAAKGGKGVGLGVGGPGFFGLVESLLVEDLRGIQNSDIRLYLTFLRYMAYLFATLGLFGITLILPLNLSGHGDAASRSGILAMASAENLAPHEWRIWALYAITWAYSIIAYIFVWMFHQAVREDPWKAPSFEQQLASFTVMVRGLDTRITNPEVIRSRFAAAHGEHLLACVLVPDYRDLHWANEQLCTAEARMERFAEISRVRAKAAEIPKAVPMRHPVRDNENEVDEPHYPEDDDDDERSAVEDDEEYEDDEAEEGEDEEHHEEKPEREQEKLKRLPIGAGGGAPYAVGAVRVPREARVAKAAKEAMTASRFGSGKAAADQVARFSEEAYYRAKVVRREKQQARHRNVGVCFLIFDSTERAHDVLTEPRFANAARASGWTLFPAPAPSDVDWENLHVSSLDRGIRAFVLSTALLLLCVLVVSPVTVLDELHPLVGDVDGGGLHEDGYTRALIKGYLPPLIILMINSSLIPMLILYISRYERFWQKSSQQSASLHMHIVFMVINSLVIPLMSLNSMGLLMKHMFETPLGDWNTAIGASFLSSSGSFAIRYLINGSLLSSATQLLQVPQAIHTKMCAALAITDAERRRALDERWRFDFGYWYAVGLSVCFICLTFSAAVPLLLPCAAFYFGMKYCIDKYNFQYAVFTVDLESRGMVASTAVNYLLSAVAFMQFCMSGLFVVQGLDLAGSLLFVCSVSTWAMIALHHSVTMFVPSWGGNRPIEKVPLKYADARQLAVLREAYLHPCERAGKEPLPGLETLPVGCYGSV
eukprot:gnl/TRDRNA2_/TRDRNA2_185560_c0_seq1.p1 gnl/TRDRNA2_/TRDRNA2_185560_c0~~gnl/TRDRNA2_/TRDRNA2_185560_c0_seq1.p1  ORF type:complete len:819 (-),score=128.17 gnl/TRDRNA2_/TRDRNA2_185560_c0_seq1:63-2519(-)